MGTAQRLRLTEADLFKAVFHHEGIKDDSWRAAYEQWCEYGRIPHNGYHHWFLEHCCDILSGKLVLYQVGGTDTVTPSLFKATEEDDDGN